jgi:hypothetical protein
MRIGYRNVISMLLLALGLFGADRAMASDASMQERPLRGMTVDAAGRGMDEEFVATGLKDALHLGIDHVVTLRGSRGGFDACPDSRLESPPQLRAQVISSGKEDARMQLAHLERRMNRVAELSVAAAAPLLHEAVTELKIAYPIEVLRAGSAAATEFLKTHKGAPIEKGFSNLVRSKMAEAGIYTNVSSMLRTLEYNSEAGKSLYDELHAYISAEALARVYATLKHEEYLIRTEPQARINEQLARVFSP